jgi:hypothetical protein
MEMSLKEFLGSLRLQNPGEAQRLAEKSFLYAYAM